ncbi:MAG: RNA methyltransferase, partial [Chloroflexi bacterium]|nr:RNA methyltransferase [Chloroflexota bacterium]
RDIAGLVERSRYFRPAADLVLQKTGRLTYRVIARKVGKHQYRRMDLQAAITKGIERQFGDSWRLVDDDAQVEVWANVIGSRLLCGIRLSDQSMRHRDYQDVNLPASLRPSVAAAMVLLTQPEQHDVFMDPMCGSGTIVAERMLAGPSRAILGGDIVWDRVYASNRNLRRVRGRSLVTHWDATTLPVEVESVGKLAVNLPFGKQIGSRSEVEKLYPRFVSELERVLRPDGIAVLLTSEYELLKEVLRDHDRLLNLTGYSIAVLGQWARIYVLKKVAESP